MKKTLLLFFIVPFFFSLKVIAQEGANPVGVKLFPQETVPGACGNHSNLPAQAGQKTWDPVSPMDGNGSLGQIYNNSACGLNYVQGSRLTTTRAASPNNNGSGFPTTVSISGLPTCRTIVQAYLWFLVSYQSGSSTTPTVSMTNPLANTFSYTAATVGSSGGKCWGEAGTRTYRVNVTSCISGNGTYSMNLTGMANKNWEIDGVTLFIIYRDLSATYTGRMIINDGAIGNSNGGANSQTMSGVGAPCSNSTAARGFIIVSDMQGNVGPSHPATINGSTASYPNSFYNFDQANTTVTGGQSTSAFGTTGQGIDCYLWGVMGLYYQTTACFTCTPSALSASTSSTNATCGNNNGTATVNPTSGTAPYTYVWNPAVAGNTNTAGGLAPGSYQVTITDATGCSTVVTVVVGGTPGPSVTASSTSAGCTVANGSATANPSGGTPGYNYSWNTSPVQNTQTANNLAPGTYVVTITDANGCTAQTSITVGVTANPSVSASSTPAGCTVANGSATANPSGGTPGYAYSWNSSPVQNTQTANNLPAGTYIVTVTDANGCTAQTSVTVGSTVGPSLSTSSTPAGCTVANGTATVNPSGGTPGYAYSWNSSPVQNTQIANNLPAGTYLVIVTDANGCTAQISVTVAVTANPFVAGSSTPAGCTVANGSATANPSGGTPGYAYSWNTSPVQNTQTANNLPAGTYIVTVTDANGCTAQTSITVGVTANPSVSASSTAAGCTVANGTATANASGGTPGYAYSWNSSPVQNTQIANNLPSGTYIVTVTDANGCTAQISVTVAVTANPTTTSSVVNNVSCNGDSSGSAATNPNGGTPGYNYLWLPSGGNSQTATGLSAGTYTVTITDANGCSVADTVTITEPTAIALTATQTNILCFGGTNGDATATASGGTGAYTYSWNTSPVQTTQTATGLSAGNYIVTVTDANGCTNVISVNILQPTLLTAPTSQTNVLCFGGNNGSATANAAGGTPGYNYSWNTNPVQTTQTINGLSPGTYIVTVTDTNGCSTQTSVTISEPPAITLAVSGNDSVCKGDSTTLITNPTGGTSPYTYVWNPGPQSGASITISPSANTSYTVFLTDANGCTSSAATFNVSILPAPTALFDTDSNGIYSSVFLFTDQSTPDTTITSWLWDFGDGSNGSALQNPVHTFPGAGTYTVTQIVFNQYGCPDTFKITVIVEEGILIPNVFTPDGDGVNDVWYIPNSGMKEFHVDIYDRWGLKVFETTADEIRWDGHSSSGKLLKDGTYYYVLKAFLKSGAEGKDYSTNGYVTLLTGKR